MAKKKDEQEKVRCGDCANGHPHKGLAVWCEWHDKRITERLMDEIKRTIK